MATSKIKIAVETKGTKKAAKEIESVGRQQTRLGQASASAGRQFSAQASGMGGLVSAYAGAAATIFALTAAFDALNRAARAEQTLAGVNALANAVGESGPEVLDMIQRITKGQLSLVQSAELANLALSSGFSTAQLEGFTDVAMRASRALGRDLTDSFQRLVRGAVKLEPELLDELGIFTRIEPAAEAYAASVGKVASQLSRFETRQAFANAVSEEGTRKYKDIDIQADTAAQSLEKLAATVSDLATNIGGIIANALAPFADALTSPVAAIGVMGILIKTVFGTTLREATSRLSDFNTNIRTKADTLQDSIGSTKRAAAANIEFSKGLKGVSLNVARVSKENETEFKSLQKKAKAMTITTAETRRYDAILKKEIKDLQVERKMLIASGVAAESQSGRMGVLNRRVLQFNAAQGAANTRLKAFGPIARTAGFAALGLGKMLGFAGKMALGAISWISIIVSYLSMIIAIGATVLDAFGWLDPVVDKLKEAVRWFREMLNITKQAVQAKDAFEALKTVDEKFSVTVGAGPNEIMMNKHAEAQAKNLENMAKQRKILEKAPKDEDALKRVNAIQQAIRLENAMLAQHYTEGSVIDKSAIDSALNTVIKAARKTGYKSSEEFTKAFATALGVNLSSSPELANVVKMLAERFSNETTATLRGRTLFAEATGMTEKAADKLLVAEKGRLRFSNEILKNEKTSLSTMTAQFKTTKEYNDLQGIARTDYEKREKVQTSLLQSQQIQANLIDAMRSGSATIEQLEQKRGAILAKNKSLIKEGSNEAKLIAEASQKDLDNLDHNLETQLNILRARKQIMKTYSAEIKAADQLSKMNIITMADGVAEFKLAISKKDQQAAQLKQLQIMYSVGKKSLAIQRAGGKEAEKLTDIQEQQAALARTAELAIVGQFQKIVEQADKLQDSIKKQNSAYIKQINILKAKKTLEDAKGALKDNEEQIKQIRKRNTSLNKTLKITTDLAKARALNLDLQRQANQDRVTDIMNEFGDLLSPQRKRVWELRIAKDDLIALKTTIEAQKKAINDKAKNDKKALQDELKFLAKQQGVINKEIKRGFPIASRPDEGLIGKRMLAQKALDEAKIKADKVARDFIIDAKAKEITLVADQINGMKEHVEGLARILLADRIERQHMLEGEKFAKQTGVGDFGKRRRTVAEERAFRMKQGLDAIKEEVGAELTFDSKTAEEGIADLRSRSVSIKTLESKAAKSARERIRDKAIEKNWKRISEILQTLENNTNLTATQIQNLDNELKKAGLSVANLTDKFRDADNVLLQVAKDVATSLSEGVAQGLRDLNQAAIEGTLTMENFKEGLKNMFVGVLGDIQQKIFERTIVKPVENFINESVLSAFGFAPERKLENALTMSGNAVNVVLLGGEGTDNLLSSVTESAEEGAGALKKLNKEVTETPFKDFLDKAGDGLSSFGDHLLGAGKGLLNFGKGLLGSFGGGGADGTGLLGLAGGAVRGIGGWFSDIFGSGTASVVASGGLVHLARGGHVRDRIPAMLEPGEFVIRKPMAKAIGGPALNAMNAHGAVANSPNVVVNMNNEGTAQEVGGTNVSVTPEAIIVDIVTRDLKNNGPIRQGIRGSIL